MNFDTSTIQSLCRSGSRGTFGKVIADLFAIHDNLRVLVADVATSSKLEKANEVYSDKIINVGIAEQNMIGIAGGLSTEGYNVFATTFAPFASMRCFESLRTQIGYMNLNVKIVGLLSGLATGSFGNTHYGLEDIAITRTIPNFTVLSPADCVETYKVIEACANYKGPCYIRLTGVNGTPPVYKQDYDFKIGKGIVLQKGVDIAIIATGTMVHESVRAARILKSKGISVTVVDMHTIKPLDNELLEKIFEDHMMIVTVEEHFKIGGLGSAIAEVKTQFSNVPKQLILGIEDKFAKVGNYSFMKQKFGLTAPQIAEKILLVYQEKK